jgi:hypothetical protein
MMSVAEGACNRPEAPLPGGVPDLELIVRLSIRSAVLSNSTPTYDVAEVVVDDPLDGRRLAGAL